MGIPGFFKWVADRYPRAVVDVIEESPVEVVNGVSVPLDPTRVDTSRPNPNGVEFDNLYLDLNGIIHPCFYPEDLPAPKSYNEVFKAIYKYIDRIFSIVRPRKLLFLAIDGVAPCAKIQQCARRFRAAKDAAVEASGMKNPKGVYELVWEELTLLEQTKKLNSTVITPGTQFMARLSLALQYYVHLRMNMDLGWQGIKVIISDANIPGEGEHKIMSYIRLQRNLPGYNPNTRHCLHGLDADLIMLALATHEIHFSILREAVCKAHTIDKTPRHREDFLPMNRRKSGQGAVHGMNVEDSILWQKFQFLNIWVLRDCLVHDLRIPEMKEDLERLIDDFVFMCLFVGNDFLPHVPSLEISEGAINLVMNIYKEEFIQIGGYLTDSFESVSISHESFLIHGQTGKRTDLQVNLERVERFVQALASHENTIFLIRSQVKLKEEGWKKRFYTEEFEVKTDDDREKVWVSSADCIAKRTQSSIKSVHDNTNFVVDKVKLGEEGWKERFYTETSEVKTDDDREKVRGSSANVKLGEKGWKKFVQGSSANCIAKRTQSSNKPVHENENFVVDKVKLREEGWQKFVRRTSARCIARRTRSSIKRVHDNANFAVDKVKIGEEGWKERSYTEKFEVKTDDSSEKVRRHAVLKYVEGLCWVMHYYYQGVCSWQWFYPYHYAPFASDFYGLDQLMCVLPAARNLMIDTSSPISDFNPTDFEIDMNGKRKAWQDEERQRNSLDLVRLFVHISHPLAVKIFCFSNRKNGHPKLPKAKVKRKINPEVSGGMNGYIYISDKPVCPLEICSPIDDMEMITKNKVVTVFYKYPSFHTHIPKPPEGVIMPSENHIDGKHGRIKPRKRKRVQWSRWSMLKSKQQESMGCMEVVDCAGVDELACQSNIQSTDYVGEVKEDSESNINGEP